MQPTRSPNGHRADTAGPWVPLDHLVAELYAPAPRRADRPPATGRCACAGAAPAARDELRRQARRAERDASTLARAVASATRLLRELRAPIATRRARRRALPAPAATRGAPRRGPQPERLARSSESTVIAAVLLMGWAVVLLRTGNGHAAIALAVAGCALSWGPLLKRRARSCNAAT